ncbi:MAG: hypothetical protein KatS3mg105_2693 [Gemmatales bacterium]|nr:MAG: hypothetical protein KatS3mg105_2693 [Gemmatales bacterium]
MSSQNLVRLTIDGKEVAVPPTKTAYDPQFKTHVEIPTTIYDAALEWSRQNNEPNPIPILCHREHVNPVAVCRVCVVDIGGRVLAPACYRPVEEGMQVRTSATSERVRDSVKTLLQLLVADQPPLNRSHHDGNELVALAQRFQVDNSPFPPPARERGRDDSSIVIAVDHDACILCDRCIRGCNEIRHNHVLGRMGKGYSARIAFDLDAPMGESSCVACGECMISCPTGALTFRRPVHADPWQGIQPPPEQVSAQVLARHPLFEGVSEQFLEWNQGSVVRRHFKKGEIICREGEFGYSAFYIEKGSVDIFIQSPLKHVKKSASKFNWGPFGLIRRFASSLVGRNEDQREEEGESRFIHIDAPVSLNYDNPVSTLGEGDIFGEMTCMSHYPRSATVRAATDCVVLEMLRNVLYILQRNKASRALLDQRYRERALDSHLRSVRIFSELLKDESRFNQFVEFLRGKDEKGDDRVELLRLPPGEVIFRQGDAADHFYLVRIGFVKVSQARPGGEDVLTYLGPGSYFGEIGLMSHIPEIRELAPPGVRIATCTALDHVDLVRINGETFYQVLEKFPEIKEQLIKVAVEHLHENEEKRNQVETVPLSEFLSQGLMNAQSLLVLDLERCTRCDECTKACADAHDGVTRLVREGLRFDKFLVASSCRSCLDPYCMVGCPVGSIRRRNSREIIIEDWCIGCGKCAENCPYGNINMHPFEQLVPDPIDPNRKIAVVQQKATMCDLCADLPDQQPSCVYACPHDAAFRMSGAEFRRRVETE